MPANQTDTRGSGWALATPQPGSLPRRYLSEFRISRKPHGAARVQGTGDKVLVDSYDVPPDAPQQGSPLLLDTLDTRLTQAVSAVDPSPWVGGSHAIWTQHTVAGGAGSEVRWYEVDPGGQDTFQANKVSGPANYHFNGAISPDRAVNGTGADSAAAWRSPTASHRRTSIPRSAWCPRLAITPARARRSSRPRRCPWSASAVETWSAVGGTTPARLRTPPRRPELPRSGWQINGSGEPAASTQLAHPELHRHPLAGRSGALAWPAATSPADCRPESSGPGPGRPRQPRPERVRSSRGTGRAHPDRGSESPPRPRGHTERG